MHNLNFWVCNYNSLTTEGSSRVCTDPIISALPPTWWHEVLIKVLLDDSSFSLPSFQSLLPGEEQPDRNIFIPLFKCNVRSRSATLTVREPSRAGSSFTASSFATIDLWINPEQSGINSEPPDEMSSSLCPISHLMLVDVNHPLFLTLTPTAGPFWLKSWNPIRTWGTSSCFLCNVDNEMCRSWIGRTEWILWRCQ